MALPALQLINSDIETVDPRGRRYSAEDREYAYLTWRVVGRRSLAKTGELTGIAENTLRAWAKEDGWQKRSDREDGDAAELARQSLATIATNEVVKSLEVITGLRDDPATPAKVRFDAAAFVLGLWGVAPVKFAEVSLRPRDDGKDAGPDISPIIRTMSPEQLMLTEQAIRDKNWGPLYATLTDAQVAALEQERSNGRRLGALGSG